MVAEAPLSIFVPNQTLELIGANFNHCSTISPYKEGVLVAWYGGTQECHDDQSVFLLYIDKDGTSTPLQLEPKTGNPVLWTENNRVYLLWSRFEESEKIKRIADRWKYCSLWMRELELNGTDLQFTGNIAFIKSKHLLGRCRPVQFKGKTYLPLYDEVRRTGVIISGKELDFKFCGRIGTDMIQPTLWVDDNKLCSLSRTFHSNHLHSQYSESTDGMMWSDPVLTDIPNRNSSLHAIDWHGYHLLLWNDTQGTRRTNLTLGVIEPGPKVRPLFLVNSYGSYPSLCEHSNGNLCLSYTSSKGNINFHTWYKDQLLAACRGGNIVGGGEPTHANAN